MKGDWSISTDNVAKGFLVAAAKCLKGEVTLCFEHAFTHGDALELYDRYQSARRYVVQRDTIFPRTRLYLCRLTEEFAQALSALAAKHETSDLFWHVKGYDDDRMIFYVHDAYCATDVVVTNRFSEGLVHQLAAASESKAEPCDSKIDWDRILRLRQKEK